MPRTPNQVSSAGSGSLLLLCALAVALHARPGPAEGAPTTVQVREVYFGENEATVCQPGRQEFVLDDLRGLYVCIDWSGLAETYAAQLTFVSPDGNVYQTMTLAFVTAEAPATVATVEVQGRQHEVQRAGWRYRGETVVVATLPVAGTYITQHNLAGRWTVKISRNGRPVDQDHFTLHLRHEPRRGALAVRPRRLRPSGRPSPRRFVRGRRPSSRRHGLRSRAHLPRTGARSGWPAGRGRPGRSHRRSPGASRIE